MDDKAAKQILRGVADPEVGSVAGNGCASPAGPIRRPVAGRTLLDSGQPAGARLDQSKPGGGEIVGLGRGALESSARPFDFLGEYTDDYCRGDSLERFQARVYAELSRDVMLGQVTKLVGTVCVEKPAKMSLDEIKRTILITEEIARRSPFQLSQMMPKDCDYLIRCEGRYFFGLHRWREFNNAIMVSESRAIALLHEWKVLDLDAAAAEHRRKHGKEPIL